MGEIKNVNALEAFEKIKEGALLLDVRSDDSDFIGFGVANCVKCNVENVADEFEFIKDEKAIIVSDFKGEEMPQILQNIQGKANGNVFVLEGGLMGWNKARLPISMNIEGGCHTCGTESDGCGGSCGC